MSSTQITFDDISTETPDEPESTPGFELAMDGIGDVPNFNRESGEIRTELGDSLDSLCERAREAPPAKRDRQPTPEGQE